MYAMHTQSHTHTHTHKVDEILRRVGSQSERRGRKGRREGGRAGGRDGGTDRGREKGRNACLHLLRHACAPMLPGPCRVDVREERFGLRTHLELAKQNLFIQDTSPLLGIVPRACTILSKLLLLLLLQPDGTRPCMTRLILWNLIMYYKADIVE